MNYAALTSGVRSQQIKFLCKEKYMKILFVSKLTEKSCFIYLC